MPTIRVIRPTDLVPLIAFFRNGSRREVAAQLWPEMQGDAGARVLRDLLRQLMVHPGGYAQSWVYVEDGAIQGLTVAMPRAGRLAWDIRDLFLADAEGPIGVELLEQVSAELARRGARRLFMSIDTGGEVARLARQAGFAQYTSEALYAIKLPAAVSPSGLRPARPRLRQDTHTLFQLYNTAVPFKVRFAEAATMEEWHALERNNRPWAPRLGGNCQHYVWEENGEAAGWLQLTFGTKSQHIQLLVHPSHAEATEEMLRYSLSQASHKAPIYASAREYQPELASALERIGFAQVAEYLIFAREMTARVPSRAWMPARA